ncbi:FAD-dependent oxidoreductase, partial [Xanthomonas hortorum pv. gardneri]|uniref:FAD-dependent oxidoreductase n=1 Tax=Xanthomonas hortorum TaxID=56454 RepID=UPI002FE1E2A3
MSEGRIAVVGSGIAGLGAAWLLSRRYEVTLFEAADYLGGHTHPHDIQPRGPAYAGVSGLLV